MKRLIALLILLAALPTQAEPPMGWSLSPRQDGSYSLGLRQSDARLQPAPVQGLLDFIDTLEVRETPLRLQWIAFNAVFQSDEIQKELLAEFAKNHPQLLAKAKGSAGNMHNPKVFPLGAAFEQALLATPSVREIDKKLARVGCTVTGVSFEKFSLDTSAEPVRFHGIINLKIAPIAEGSGAGGPRRGG
jgi:hypothetical protein